MPEPYISPDEIKRRQATMKQWVKRRTDKGVSPTADELWQRIKENWPMMGPEAAEEVFQGS